MMGAEPTGHRSLRSSDIASVSVRLILPSIVIAAVLAVFGFWARNLKLMAGSVPVYGSPGRSFWIAGIALMIVAAAVSQLLTGKSLRVDASEPAVSDQTGDLLTLARTAWMYPLALVGCVLLLLEVYHRPLSIAGIAVAAGLALVFGMLSRQALVDDDPVRAQRARGLFTALIHAVAFVGLSMIYINKLRSIFSAPLVFVLGALLLFQITEGEDVEPLRRAIYALTGGFVLAESTWLLNYWRATGWIGGATLLIFFYFMAGIMAIQARREAGRNDVYEYGVIGGVAFAIIAFAVLR